MCSDCDIRTAKSPSNVIGRKHLPSVTKIPQGIRCYDARGTKSPRCELASRGKKGNLLPRESIADGPSPAHRWRGFSLRCLWDLWLVWAVGQLAGGKLRCMGDGDPASARAQSARHAARRVSPPGGSLTSTPYTYDDIRYYLRTRDCRDAVNLDNVCANS